MKRMFFAAFFAALAAPALAEDAKDYVAQCSAGSEKACLRGTQLAQASGDTPLLVTFAATGCKHGFTISCADRGMLVVAGIDTSGKTSLSEAVTLVVEACKDGYGRACTNVGYMMYTGTGLRQDTAGAAGYYKRGCNNKSGAGCYNLSLMIEDGEVPQAGNPSVSTLRQKACALGERRGC